MKFLKLTFSLLFVLLLVSNTQAQSVDDIIKKYFENTGGLDKWKTVKTVTSIAKINQMGMDFPGTMYQKMPNKMKQVFEVQGQKFINAFDGTAGWKINPFGGTGKAEPLTEEENKEMSEGAQLESEFYNYSTKGHKVTLEGKETIEGTECFKIKLVKKSGKEEFHFFDTENYVPIMQRSIVQMGPMKGKASETFFSDYKEVAGLMFPHSVQSKVDGQVGFVMTIESMKINEDIDDKEFAIPSN